MKLFTGRRLGGGLLIGSVAVANVLNFAFNAYLGRVLTADDFGVLSFVSSLLYLVSIPLNALQGTATNQTAFLEGREGAAVTRAVLLRLRKRMLLLGVAGVAVWLLLTPWLSHYFRIGNSLPAGLFAVVPLIGFVLAVDRGRLSGHLLFGALGVVTVGEPLMKLALGVGIVGLGWSSAAYLAIPLSVVGAYVLTELLIGLAAPARRPSTPVSPPKDVSTFQWGFFLTALLSGFSAMTFLTFDVLLAKHFLTPEQAGQYALISLIGKITYFLGTLCMPLLIPLVSRAEGERRSSGTILSLVIASALGLALFGFWAFGLEAGISAPILFGAAGKAAVAGAPWIAAGAMCFAVTRIFISYHLARRQYAFVAGASTLVVVQIVLIAANHDTPLAIAHAMAATGIVQLLVILALHFATPNTSSIAWNLSSLAGIVLPRRPGSPPSQQALRILILNWRDTRHKWAGGAEVYVQEVAARWARAGMRVTLFCGNDQHSPAEEVVDGVQVIRRGGFFTVYAWSLIYYLFRFRGNFDVVVDSENGIPFFSPLYARIPVVLLIHHVHQEVFTRFLPRPFAGIARFLEGTAMPRAYRRCPVVTVSDSSRADICAHGLSSSENVSIVHPGVDLRAFGRTGPKANYPLFTYLGRLKPYKHVDTAILAFARLLPRHPEARLAIAGDGESREDLMCLVERLGIAASVKFLGRVSEEQKRSLLAQSWAAVQPSMVEGWGITVIEANACGAPVIAHDVSGLRDAVVDGLTGRLVEPMNVEQFSLEMMRIIEDGDWRARLQRSAVAWARRFDWDHSAGLFANILMARARRAVEQYVGPVVPVEVSANLRYVTPVEPEPDVELKNLW